MSWTGLWRNQYGSTVRIDEDADGRITGTFETALTDSGFHGRSVPLVGVARGNCISFASVGTGPAGDMVVSYTGLLRNGRLEAMWYYAADTDPDGTEVPWWKAVIANADTFERVD